LFLAGHSEAAAGGTILAPIAAAAGVDDPELSEADKKVVAAIKKQTEQAIKDAQKGLMTAKEFEDKLNEFRSGMKEKELKELYDAFMKQGIDINKIKEGFTGGSEAPKTLKQQLGDMFKTNPDFLATVKDKSKPVEIIIKAAGTMVVNDGTNTSLTGTATPYYIPNPSIQPGIISIARNRPIFLDYCDVAPTNSAVLVWVNEKNVDGDAAFTLEGGLKSLADFDLEAETSTARKATIRFKISEEMLDDIPGFEAEIRTKGEIRLRLKIDESIRSGNGTAPALKGITAYAPGYTITSLNDTVNAANNYDAVKAAIVQIQGSSDEWYPNVLFINPIDKFAMEHTKTTQEDYVLMKLQLSNGSLFNLTVVETNQIPAGYFLLGDMTKSHVRIYKDIRMEVGWENDDFSKNLRTIIMEARLHHYISDNEKTAFVYDQFSVVKAALETP
jgi:HK97 family phage major capsid protein